MSSEHANIPLLAEAEVVVLGGGPAGIGAAVAAARNGARTLLVERYGCLGGGGTLMGASAFDGLHANVHGEIKQVVHGVVDEILKRIDALDGLNKPHLVQDRIFAQSYDIGAWKIAADELALSAGVSLLFHALGVGAIMDADRTEALLVETKSGRGKITGQVFIDCSGDADLAAWAGVPFDRGDAEGFLQPAAMLFRLGGVDNELAEAALPDIPAKMEAAVRSGEFNLPRTRGALRPLKHAGEWRANLTKVTRPGGVLDGTDVNDLTYAEIEGRRQVRLYWTFLRAKVPGFENCYVIDVGPEVGIRETRRIRGKYELLASDITSSNSFDDAVGVNGWPVEKHMPSGIQWQFPVGRGYNQLPYRCLVPIRVSNLLVAGRCISAEPDAQAAIRVTGPCFVTGEAAGTAAALAVSQGCGGGEIEITALQSRLQAGGVFLGCTI